MNGQYINDDIILKMLSNKKKTQYRIMNIKSREFS